MEIKMANKTTRDRGLSFACAAALTMALAGMTASTSARGSIERSDGSPALGTMVETNSVGSAPSVSETLGDTGQSFKKGGSDPTDIVAGGLTDAGVISLSPQSADPVEHGPIHAIVSSDMVRVSVSVSTDDLGGARLTLSSDDGPRGITLITDAPIVEHIPIDDRRVSTSYRGYLQNGGRFVLATSGVGVWGAMWTPEGAFEIRGTGELDALGQPIARIVEVADNLPACMTGISEVKIDDQAQPVARGAGAGVIRVLVTLTPGAVSDIGGPSLVDAFCAVAIASVNGAYDNSNIAPFRLELAGCAVLDNNGGGWQRQRRAALRDRDRRWSLRRNPRPARGLPSGPRADHCRFLRFLRCRVALTH